MHPILVRILKQGIPVAVILAVVGFVLAEAAGMWFAMQSAGDSTVRVTVGDATGSADGGKELTRALRTRMPFTMAAERGSSASSRTVPRSLKRMGTPSRRATTRPAKSAGLASLPATRTSVSWGPNSRRPAGISRFSAASVASTCSMGTACAASRSGSSSTTMARFSVPIKVT